MSEVSIMEAQEVKLKDEHFLVHYDNITKQHFNSTKNKERWGAQLLLTGILITFTAFHRKIPREKSANVMERNIIVQALSYSP